MKTVVTISAVWLTLFAVPVLVYGALSAPLGLEIPANAPIAFLSGVALSKLGTAIAFVLLYQMITPRSAPVWPHYAALWWLMFAMGELGQAIGPGYSWPEALAGMISEAVCLPTAGCLLSRVFRQG